MKNQYTHSKNIQSMWLKVSDGIPEEWLRVLTYNGKTDEIRIDYIILCNECDGFSPSFVWGNIFMDQVAHITHWRPLPERPLD